MMDNNSYRLLRYAARKQCFPATKAQRICGKRFAGACVRYLTVSGYLEYQQAQGGEIFLRISREGQAVYENILYERSYNVATRRIAVIAIVIAGFALVAQVVQIAISLLR